MAKKVPNCNKSSNGNISSNCNKSFNGNKSSNGNKSYKGNKSSNGNKSYNGNKKHNRTKGTNRTKFNPRGLAWNMGLFTLWITNFNFTPFLVLSKNVVLRFFVANILHRTVLHCILNDSHKYCCHFSMKTCSCPSRNDDPLKFIKLIWSIGHTKFRFIFFSRLFNVTWNRQLRPIWPNGLFQFYIFQSPLFYTICSRLYSEFRLD